MLELEGLGYWLGAIGILLLGVALAWDYAACRRRAGREQAELERRRGRIAEEARRARRDGASAQGR